MPERQLGEMRLLVLDTLPDRPQFLTATERAQTLPKPLSSSHVTFQEAQPRGGQQALQGGEAGSASAGALRPPQTSGIYHARCSSAIQAAPDCSQAGRRSAAQKCRVVNAGCAAQEPLAQARASHRRGLPSAVAQGGARPSQQRLVRPAWPRSLPGPPQQGLLWVGHPCHPTD